MDKTKLTEDEKEEIQEIYSFGYFMKEVLSNRKDAEGKNLTEDDVLKLIAGGKDVNLFHSYSYYSEMCESCGSHGSVKAMIEDKEFTLKTW